VFQSYCPPPLGLEVATSTVFASDNLFHRSSNCAHRWGRIRQLCSWFAELFFLLACCVAVVALSGCGSLGAPALTVSPNAVAFGNVAVGAPSMQPVILTSIGTMPVTVNSGTVTGTGFTLSGATFPLTVNPGQAVTLEVQFNPTAPGAAAVMRRARGPASSGM